jgi:Sec-independent protein translocase protein TatA
MIKWFAYIVLLLILAPALLSAKEAGPQYYFNNPILLIPAIGHTVTDTVTSAKNAQNQDDKKKIKEIGKAKRQPKPEKIVTDDQKSDKKTKSKRQHRPEGLERPPEIPRRSGD